MYMKTGVYTPLLSSVELTLLSFVMYGVQQFIKVLFLLVYIYVYIHDCMYAFTCYRCTQL